MKLNLEQKIELLDGLDVWHTKPLEGLPSCMMADGPHGIRKQRIHTDNLGSQGSYPATCYPTASLLACSFDRNLLKDVGYHIAKEAKAQQVNVVLGPGINMKRTPLCGRNFEYFSEDPYLAGELAASYVRAVEDEGVGTSVKHFFANNQERYRFTIDAIVDERALREIYLKAFERVIKENPATVMASYNKINGFYATEHPYLSKILRKEWGYYGVVVSDWGAVHHRVNSLLATTDLEMPSSLGYRSKHILEASQSDEVRQAINKSADRIINMVKTYKTYDNESFDIDKHHQEAIRIARESMVLLKNQDILPLSKEENILVVGGFIQNIRYQGAGSSHINPTKLEQVIDVLSDYTHAYTTHNGYSLSADKLNQTDVKEVIELAKKADKIVYFLGLPESAEAEGYDREHLNIPDIQVELLSKIHEVNPNIIGVALGGSVMNLSFEKKYLKGLLLAYLGGQGASRAIFDLLYGIENPSGRLAETWIDDIKLCNVQLTNNNNAVYYDESIYIGYRYYQSFNQKPHFPFGYGLSYTTFSYRDISVLDCGDYYEIKMYITNSGNVKGKEVVQVYIQNNESTVHKARLELKAFDKVELEPEQTKEVIMRLAKSAFAHYDIYKKRFVIEKGAYGIFIGKNVCDEIDTIDIELDGEELHHSSISYQKYTYDTSDFKKLIPFTCPPEHIKRERPYTLSSTLEDAKHTLLGKMVAKIILSTANKMVNLSDDMKEVAKKTMMETPLQMLVLFSSGAFTFEMGEGLVDILNGKLFRGLKKLRQKKERKS